MKTKRFLSILLSLVLVLGMLPSMSLTAFAEGNTTTITPGTDDAKTGTGTMTITLKIKAAQTITASDVTATYGDTDKAVSASVTTPSTGGGTISYAVNEGSGDYISVASDGKLTINKVPPTDGKAYVIVTAAATDDYAETTKEVTVTISKAEVTVTALNQSIMVGGTVPDLSAPVLDTHYSVTGLVGEDTLTTAPTLAYQKNGSAATPDSATAGTYDIVPSGASAGDNYTVSYTNGTLTITAKDTQTITASDVTATYGDTDKNVSATTDGNGEISYTVKAGSENYIDVNTSTGALTIKAVPADGKAYVTVKATETTTGGTGDKGYAAATKDVTVNISKATVTIAAKDQSIYVGGTVPTLSGADFYTVTGLVGTDTLTTAPTLAYQKNGSAATPDNNVTGTYDIVASGASAGDNYNISYTKGALTISEKQPATVTKIPTAKTLTYTGSAQALVTAGTATGGEMQYALGTATEATQPYTTSIPAKTDAGTYYVWYKAVGDANHSDSAPVCLTVKISAEPIITGADLVLDGTLTMRFHVALPSGFDTSGAHMVLTIRDRSYDIPISKAGTVDGRRTFPCPVFSIEMAEPIKAEFHYTKGGAAKTATLTASIKDYLDALDAQGGQSAELSNLIAAVRNYGHYIQPYLARLHDFTVGDGGYAEMPAASGIKPASVTQLDGFKTKWNGYNGTLLESVTYYDTFDTSTYLNVQVKLKSARTLTATVDGAAVEVTELGGNVYAVRTPGIAANNLGTPARVVFSAGSTVICNIDVSALTYVRAVLASGRNEEDELAALTAFYNYYTAAKDYAG